MTNAEQKLKKKISAIGYFVLLLGLLCVFSFFMPLALPKEIQVMTMFIGIFLVGFGFYLIT